MNTPLLFLLGAVALSALGGLVVWIASRPRPQRFGSTIDSFTRDLDALAPPGARPQRPSRPAAAAAAVAAPAGRRQTPTPGAPRSHVSNGELLRPRPGPRAPGARAGTD